MMVMSRTLLKVFLFLLLLIGQGSLLAQNYLYPVATGTSWSRDVYTEVERQDLETMHNAPAIEGAPAFSKIFSDFKASYMKYQAYNDSIFKNMPQDQWIDMFGRRSKNYSDSYEQNNMRILMLDTDKLDFVANEKDYQMILEAIDQPYEIGLHRITF